MKSVSKLLVVAALLASSAGVAAYAQTAAPPPKKPANSTANTAGYTAPGSTEGGSAYVGPSMSERGRKVTPEKIGRASSRERECKFVYRSGDDEYCKNKKKKTKQQKTQ